MKLKIILKSGGGRFLGGVIIRSLLRWDGSKTARKFGDDRHSETYTTKEENFKRKYLKEKPLQRKNL